MVDRRRVLQIAAVSAAGLSLPACRGTTPIIGPAPSPSAPDQQQSDELALIAAYDAAIAAAGRKSRAVYQRLRDEHAAHLSALGWDDQAPSPTPAAPPTRRRLVRAERRAMRLRTTGAQQATDPDQAQLLALIAASEAQHIVTLEGL